MQTNHNELPQEETAKPFLQHLDDLRKALIWSAVAVFAGMGVACAFAPLFFRILKRPLIGVVADPDAFIRTLDVTGGLSVAMQTIVWGGLLFSAPVILFSICWFVFPGLTRRERRALLGGLLFAACLFIGGVTLCYFLALGPALAMMLWVNDWLGIRVDYVTVTSYTGFVLKLMLSFGLTFELPVILLVLGQLGIINAGQLRNKRRHAIIIILILAAIITPTQDPFSQLILAGPLIALYELCIWLIWFREESA
ncbi:MAG: twin-arginine translocase subunit TatC [bacterium]